MRYYKFYIQKESDGAAVMETGAEFEVYETQCKFYGGGEVKDLPKREWYDEHGEDEFVPDEMKFKSQEMEVKFSYKGNKNSANNVIRTFMSYLSTGGSMKIFDEYNQIGRQNVRFVSISDDAELVRNDSEGDILIFTVKFKVNDPVTNITLSK